jgi:probable rRNA maturation factor
MSPARRQRAGGPEVDIQVASPLWEAEPRAEKAVRDAAAAAAGALSTSEGEVSILLTDDSGIRQLNRDWRGIDKPTNVLSFPSPQQALPGGGRFLGDIAIAYETLRRECDDENRDFLHHLTHLTVHGFLHLNGYDHETDTEAEEMEALESRIMTRMKMPDPWRETSHEPSRKAARGKKTGNA